MPVLLRRTNRANDVIVPRPEKADAPNVAIANDSVGVYDENRTRYSPRNQRERVIRSGNLALDIRKQSQWKVVMLHKSGM